MSGLITRNRLFSALISSSFATALFVSFLTPSMAQVPPPELNQINRNPVTRDLQQLRDDVERYRQAEEIRQLQEKRQAQKSSPASKPQPSQSEGAFRFQLNQVDHSESLVLSDQEIAQAISPYVNREVSVKDLKDMLASINELYREKGYVVCEARLLPQRIRNGRLFVTLIEGKTGKLTVSGNEHTKSNYIIGAFSLPEGEVGNYREMSEDLVRFNMTNDVELRIDIRAGTEPGTTDYEITASEPANWTATVFADSLGTRSTGRARAGASITNRSVFGRRDSATLLGLASEGSKSAMFSYSLPLTSYGTRLVLGASYGEVEVIQGPSADSDVTGESEYYSARLEHPFFVDADGKWTIYGEWNRQKSTTDFWSITINDTRIDSLKTGVEAIALGDFSVFYVTAGLTHATVNEYTFDERWTQNYASGNVFWRYRFRPSWTLTTSGAWQAVLGGDPLSSSQYFYLGNSSGVRGYDNDVLSAEEGAYLNVQLDWAFLGPQTSLFTFLDAGKLAGTSSYSKKEIASIGAGITWPLFEGASITGTGSVPLKRHLGEDIHVNKARFDLSVTAVW